MRKFFLTAPVSYKRISSKFSNSRKHPVTGQIKSHKGTDFAATAGSEIYATADGKVRLSTYNGSFGNYIEIDHGYGFVTVYGHLSNRNVKKGDIVVRGQKIGEVGNTGRSTAPHLHYEVLYKNKHTDPKNYYFVLNS